MNHSNSQSELAGDAGSVLSTSRKFGLMLNPQGTLLFRDGRPLEAGFLHRSHLPTPQTLTGALRAGLLRYFKCDLASLDRRIQELARGRETNALSSEKAFCLALSDCFPKFKWVANLRFEGPWLMQQFPKAWNRSDQLLLPLPVSVQRCAETGTWSVLEPLAEEDLNWQGTDAASGDELRPLWTGQQEPTEFVEGFIRPEAMGRFLERSREATLFEDYANHRYHQDWYVRREDLLRDAPTIGIRRDLDRKSVEEGAIYAPCELAFPSGIDHNGLPCPRTVFYARIVVPPVENDPGNMIRGQIAEFLRNAGLISFGGRGHEVEIESYSANPLPSAMAVNRERLTVVATTPVLADNLAKPARLLDTGVRVVSACIPRRWPVSGWDASRRCSQPTRYAAAAGSIYFVELQGEDAQAKDLQRMQLMEMSSLSPSPFDQHGWGCFTTGCWDYMHLGFEFQRWPSSSTTEIQP